jgi:signal transduction histidine kinase
MSVGSRPAASTQDNDLRIEREQVRLTFGTWVQYADGAPFAIALTVLMCGALPEVGRASWIAGSAWLAAQFLWTAVGSLAYRFYAEHEARYAPKVWRALLLALWTSNAAIWGAALLFFWDHNSPINQAVLTAFGLGVMVTYFFSLTPCYPVLCAAIATISSLAWAVFLANGGTLPYVFMVVFPLFVILLLNHGAIAARKYTQAFRLRFENEALAAELAKAHQAKSAFLASISHDLRTPLNAIVGYTDMIRQRTLGPIAPASYAAYIEDIHAGGSALLAMIDNLFDLANLERGRREFVFAPMHVNEAVRQAVAALEPEAARRHVNLMTDLPLDVTIKADASAVRQIVINLLSNAIRHSSPGGVVVVYCEVLPDDRIAMGVKDTGAGMSAEIRERLLNPLSDPSDVYTVEGRNAGMGMPIVKALIEAHQGRLLIESALGSGSKIWVEFPPERLLRRALAA